MAEPNTSAHRFAKVFCEKLHFSLFFRLLRPPASKGGFSVVEINGTGMQQSCSRLDTFMPHSPNRIPRAEIACS